MFFTRSLGKTHYIPMHAQLQKMLLHMKKLIFLIDCINPVATGLSLKNINKVVKNRIQNKIVHFSLAQ